MIPRPFKCHENEWETFQDSYSTLYWSRNWVSKLISQMTNEQVLYRVAIEYTSTKKKQIQEQYGR